MFDNVGADDQGRVARGIWRRRPIAGAAYDAAVRADRRARRAPAAHRCVRRRGGARRTRRRAARPTSTPAAYEAIVERAKEYIRAGDVIQVVLAQRFELPLARRAVRRLPRLRTVNPSPVHVLPARSARDAWPGASPEVMVRRRGRRGRRCGRSPARGRAAPSEREDARARAPSCAPIRRSSPSTSCSSTSAATTSAASRAIGTVEVTERLVVERYSHVMHLVSNVRGQLAPGRDCFDAFRADVPGRHAHRARRRSAPWRSSRSSSRCGAASTAARSATSASRATWTPAIAIRTMLMRDGTRLRPGGRRHRRRLGSRARAPRVRQQGARGAAGGAAGGAAVMARMLLMIDNYDSFTYNLVQYLGELGADVRRAPQRRASRSTRSPRCAPDGIVISPGPCTPRRGGHLGAAHPALRRRDPDPRRLPRPPGDRRRASAATSCAPPRIMHGKTSPIRHDGTGALRGPAEPVRRHALPLAGHRAGDAARCARGHGVDGRGRDHGRAPSRRVRRGRAVPPRVDPDARGQAPARELPRASPGRLRARREAHDARERHRPRSPSGRDLAADEMAGRHGGDHGRRSATPAQIGALLVALRMKGETRRRDRRRGARAARARRRACPARRATSSTPAARAATARHVQRLDRGGAGRGGGGRAGRQARQPRRVGQRRRRRRARGARRAHRARRRRSWRRCLDEVGIALPLRAGAFTRRCATWRRPRRELGVRTIFNLLGPLTNPAGVRRAARRASSTRALVEPLAHALGRLGSERALVVHGDDGLDELALDGPRPTWPSCATARVRRFARRIPTTSGSRRRRSPRSPAATPARIGGAHPRACSPASRARRATSSLLNAARGARTSPGRRRPARRRRARRARRSTPGGGAGARAAGRFTRARRRRSRDADDPRRDPRRTRATTWRRAPGARAAGGAARRGRAGTRRGAASRAALRARPRRR